MSETPPDRQPPGEAGSAMGDAPAVEVRDRERIRAGARAKLFGELMPTPSSKDADAGRPKATTPAKDPERVGRFRILDRLGAGGMGVVYSAYDPELDRKVALKLLRPDIAEDASQGSTGTTRLQREAQAMARLNHPNVVTVHEVGRHGEQVFVAMEFVAGQTLRTWAESEHDWQEVLRVYRDAAAGLAAAHDAGIVHRDFKPDNVMLGDDGRVRVMDFGLSRAEPGEVAAPDDAQHVAGDNLTRTGMLMGTPAYMAPEQHNAAPTSDKSDQFAFCVAVWEALAGERPFEGRTYGELAGNVAVGRVRDPPGTAAAPTRIFDVLRRGLAVRPDERHDSMQDLANALAPPQRGKGVWVGLGLLAVAGVGAGVYATREPPPSVEAGACDDAGDPIRKVWNAAASARIKDALAASGAPYADASWQTVSSMLDRYADTWAATAQTVCAASMVKRGDANATQRQSQCLASRRSDVAALVDVLSTREDGLAQQAVQAVVTLAPLEACTDPSRLEGFSIARDPDVLAELSEARARLARAKARGGLGNYAEAVEEAEAVVQEGKSLDDPATEAAGLLVRGQYEERVGNRTKSESTLRAAIKKAEIAHDHTTRALALIRLIYVVGSDPSRHDEALTLGADAGAVLRMLGADPLLQAKLDMNLGGADRAARKLDDALDHYEAALDAYLELFGESHPETGRALTSLGSVLIIRDEPKRAIEVLQRARTSFETTLGAQHPFVPLVISNLGTAHTALDNHERAIEMLEQALALRTEIHGPDHPGVAKTLFNLGNAQYKARRYEDAIATLREGIRAVKTSNPPKARLGRYHIVIGGSLTALGRLDEAREEFDPWLDVYPLVAGREGEYARKIRYNLAMAYIPKDLRRARLMLQSALETATGDEDYYEGMLTVLWLIDTAQFGPTLPVSALDEQRIGG
ncbi:MAG: serine/threonine-protein kinase [Myxococcota bacterium]